MSNFTDYISYTFTSVSDEIAEILMAELGELPFESFDAENETLAAYISTLKNNETIENEVLEIAKLYDVTFEKATIKGENWNAAWESSFHPVEIANKVRIRADFHDTNAAFPFEITINPKMAFGTGHHFTTKLVMESMFDVDFNNKNVLDMGCGTGILAILAHQLGASSVLAIDNDPQCIESVEENVKLNNATTIQKRLLDGDLPIFEAHFDIVIANIQRNVLLEQMNWYATILASKGTLFLSGIYTQDVAIITQKAIEVGFDKDFSIKEENNWVAITMHKN